jgi:hypothetical protein
MIEERIRQRAYEIWVREGQPQGRDAEHWAQACREIEAEGAEAGGAMAANDTTPVANDVEPAKPAKPKAPRKAAASRSKSA